MLTNGNANELRDVAFLTAGRVYFLLIKYDSVCMYSQT